MITYTQTIALLVI